MKIADFFRQLRGKITGLNAISARFDMLQSQINILLADKGEANKAVKKIEDVAEKVERLLISLQRVKTSNAQLPRIFKPKNSLPLIANCDPDFNSSSRLAFLVHSLELCNHFGPVWDMLPKGSFDVLLHGLDEIEARNVLDQWHCQIYKTDEVLGSGTRYAYLVSNHPVAGSNSKCNSE